MNTKKETPITILETQLRELAKRAGLEVDEESITRAHEYADAIYFFDVDHPKIPGPAPRYFAKKLHEDPNFGVFDSHAKPKPWEFIAMAKKEFAENFVACLNACDGMQDPVSEVVRLKHSFEFADFILEGARMDRQELKELRAAGLSLDKARELNIANALIGELKNALKHTLIHIPADRKWLADYIGELTRGIEPYEIEGRKIEGSVQTFDAHNENAKLHAEIARLKASRDKVRNEPASLEAMARDCDEVAESEIVGHAERRTWKSMGASIRALAKRLSAALD